MVQLIMLTNQINNKGENMIEAQLQKDSNLDREFLKINKPVGIKDGSIYFLEEIFKYKDGFKGAVGTVFDPVTQSEIDENNDLDNATEFHRELWQQAVEGGHTEQSLSDYVEDCLNHQDGEYPGHDNSYSDLHDEAKKHFDKDVETFHCSGGGRCFNKELLSSFDKVIDQSLIDLIKQYED